MHRVSFLGLLALFAPDAARAAETSIWQVPPVVVSATRSEGSALTTPASITVIDRQAIAASGARQLAEVLRGRGGVQVSDPFGDGSRATVGMRGFGATAQGNVLILIDGRRLNNTDIGPPDLNTIDLEEVERVEIVQGSAGTLFGDQAVGGVVNIITRRPERLGASAELGHGSYSRRRLEARLTHRFDNGLGYRLGYQDRTFDNYRDNNRSEYRNLSLRAELEHGRGLVFGEIDRVNDDQGAPGELFRDELSADRRQSTKPRDRIVRYTRVARLGLSQDLAESWSVEVEATRRDEEVDSSLELFNAPGSLSQRRRVRQLTPRLVGAYPVPGGELLITLGSDLTYSDYAIDGRTFFGPFSTSNDQRIRAYYGQGVVALSDTLELTAGLRRAEVDNDLTDSFAFPNGSRIRDRVTVRELGLSYRWAPGWRLFGRRDENFRFAKVDEHTSVAPGAAGLETQTGTSYELGLEGGYADLAGKVLIYRLDLDNEIDFDPLRFVNVNLDPTRREGLILEARYRASPRLSLAAEYSYTDARFDRGPFDGKRIPLVARHVLRLSGELRPAPGWTLFGELQAIGEQVPSGDPGNEVDRLPGYGVVNLRAAYVYRGWSLSLRVDNLLGHEYSDFGAAGRRAFGRPLEPTFFPAPERNLGVTLRFDY